MSWPRDLWTGRASREVVIRTRLSQEQVVEQLTRLAEEGPPSGLRAIGANYFFDGAVGDREFRIDYLHNAPRNPQTFAVHGAIEDTGDWRYVHVRIRARSHWLGLGVFAILVGFTAWSVYDGRIPLDAAVFMVGAVILLLALANLIVVPSMAMGRVARLLALELRGAFEESGQWTVPPRE